MKKILIILCLFNIAALFSDEVFNRLSEDAFQIIEKKIPENSVITMGEIKKDDNDILKNRLEEKISQSADYKLLDMDNLDKITKKSIIQQEMIFDEEKKIELGKIQPASWLISGEFDFNKEMILFKEKRKYKLLIKIDNLETGLNFTSNLDYKLNKQPSLKMYLLINLILILIFFLINFLSKSYYAVKLFVLMNLLLITFNLWYWII